VPFPFSDLSEAKLRPAIVLAAVSRRDYVLCQITSNAYSDARAIKLTDRSFSSGSLRITSYARPGKLFTGNRTLALAHLGKLNNQAFQEVIKAVIDLLGQGQ